MQKYRGEVAAYLQLPIAKLEIGQRDPAASKDADPWDIAMSFHFRPFNFLMGYVLSTLGQLGRNLYKGDLSVPIGQIRQQALAPDLVANGSRAETTVAR